MTTKPTAMLTGLTRWRSRAHREVETGTGGVDGSGRSDGRGEGRGAVPGAARAVAAARGVTAGPRPSALRRAGARCEPVGFRSISSAVALSHLS